jgi:ATP-dependent DNA helicase RecG
MTLDELKARLEGLEWTDIEFKEAAWQVPRDIYETVSAFSNTSGGWIVFGVKDTNGTYSIEGVIQADQVQNTFVGTLRQRGKFSCAITFEEDLLNEGDKTLLVFYIPEAGRQNKPVHLDGDLGKAFVRKAGSTQRCNANELAAFVRDASNDRYEDEIAVNLDPASCFDSDSLRWYRTSFAQKNPGHETEGRPDLEFLEHFGLVVPHEGSASPTRAAILLFGTAAACNRIFSRQQVDFFRFLTRKEDTLPETRWDDRIETLSEGNLIKSWRRIIEVWREHYHSGGRFELDATTMERTGAPPDYLSFREAVLNLLIHQDYGDQTRKATIHTYTDTFEFWNPGASFVCGDEFFQAGDKPVRNPKLRNMLTRVGIGEQANTGIRNMFAHQRSLGRVAPVIENDPANHCFRLVLSKERSLSDRQQALLERLGTQLSDSQAAIFLHCWRRGTVTLHEAQAVAGTGIAETSQDLRYLETQVLLQKTDSRPGQAVYLIPEHLREAHPVPDLLPEQPPQVTPQVTLQVTPQVEQLLRAMEGEHSRDELQDLLNLTDRENFRKTYLLPGLEAQWIERTIPHKPTSRLQKYRLTKNARQWLAANPQTA